MVKNEKRLVCFLFAAFSLFATAALGLQSGDGSSDYLAGINQSIMRPGMDVIREWMKGR